MCAIHGHYPESTWSLLDETSVVSFLPTSLWFFHHAPRTMDKSLDELIAESGGNEKKTGGSKGGAWKEKAQRVCYNCGQEGHEAKDCTNARVEQSFRAQKPRRCYNCQQFGHEAAECVNPRAEPGTFVCFTCGGTGHQAWQCPSGQSGGGRGGGGDG